MNWLKELIKDNKYILDNYGIKHLIIVWTKIIGYLIITPLINLFLLWKVWVLGILFIPVTYVAYIIVLQGRTGVMKLSIKLMSLINKILGWFKK